jgi:hypothetical protein
MQINKNNYAMFVASFALVLTLMAMPLILAEENITNESVILDDETLQDINDDLNESVSGFDVTKAKMGLWFTFNQEKKAEKELNLARLELIRARNFAKNNNTKAMENSFEAHNRYIEKVQARINSMNGDSTEKGAKKSAEKLVGLERAIEVHEARIQKFKDLIAGDSNLTEEQIEKIEARISQAENNTVHLKSVQEAKREKLKTKLMAVGNLSEDEAEKELENLEDEQNLSEVKRLIAEKRLFEFEEHLENFKEKVSEAEAEGENVTFAQARIFELERIAQEAKGLIQQGEYDEAIDKLKEFGEYKKELEKQSREQNRGKNKSFGKFNEDSEED